MKSERSSLLLVATSLLVIVAIEGLVLRFHQQRTREELRERAISAAGVLSRVPLDRLLDPPAGYGPLQMLQSSQSGSRFAYAAVFDPAGELLASAAQPGVEVPRVPLAGMPSLGPSERLLAMGEGSEIVREFAAPIVSAGEIAAHMRVGYFEPGLSAAFRHIPFLATLALLVFLLAPLHYLLLRREMQPLAAAHENLLAADPAKPLELSGGAGGEVGELLQSFSQLFGRVQNQLSQLRERHDLDLACSRVLSWEKARFEAVLDSLPDAAIVLDRSGVAIFSGTKARSVLGVAPEGVTGRPLREWCVDPRVADFIAAQAEGTARGKRAVSLELDGGEGGRRRLSIGAWPIHAVSGASEIGGTLVLVRDITAESVASRGQVEFLSHVAHELKSPLHVFAGYSEALLGKDGASEDFRIEACNVIQDEVGRLSSLIDTLLAIARIESGAVVLERQRVRLPDFLKDVLEVATRLPGASGLQLELQAPGDLGAIHVDKGLLRIALNNLLGNAIKYNQPGGSVWLSAEETPETVILRVRDSGLGIPTEEQTKVFERFYRSQNAQASGRGGHGLGLTLASEIVALHGGRIELQSVPGEGSEFSIMLDKSPVLLREMPGEAPAAPERGTQIG